MASFIIIFIIIMVVRSTFNSTYNAVYFFTLLEVIPVFVSSVSYRYLFQCLADSVNVS